MGNLFDELKKAKLIDEKRAKQLAHEARVDRKKTGIEDRDEERARKVREFEARRKKEAGERRAAENKRREAELARERWAKLKQKIASRALEKEGRARWHFQTEVGTLPFLPVSSDVQKRLEGGELGIVRDPNLSWPRFVILPRDLVLELGRLDSQAVRFLAGS